MTMTRFELHMLHEELCHDAEKLMADKNADYAIDTDPFRNFRIFGELGILVRMSDKLARLRTFSERGTLAVADESVRDTILDLINYSVLLYGYIEDTRPLDVPVGEPDFSFQAIKDSYYDVETYCPPCIGNSTYDPNGLLREEF